MLSSKLWALAVVCAACCVTPLRADNKPANPPPDYVRLSAEIRGTLQVEKDVVRVRVFLGGSCLIVFYDVWELDFGKNDELKAMATKLNGKLVVVTGAIPSRNLLELGGKPVEPQQILSVKTLTAAPAK